MGSNLNNVEFRAEKARLLTKPRYAWVINFVDGEKIAIENVVLGHTEEGYCRGGVLRFENCKDVLVADTDLFGSGTYGLELVNCINVHFDNCTIRNVHTASCEFEIAQD
jgi:polygalacturonase